MGVARLLFKHEDLSLAPRTMYKSCMWWHVLVIPGLREQAEEYLGLGAPGQGEDLSQRRWTVSQRMTQEVVLCPHMHLHTHLHPQTHEHTRIPTHTYIHVCIE